MAATVYRISVKGGLSPAWAAWFDGFAIEPGAAATTLTGPVRDQAALHGLLERIRDLGLVLVRVEAIDDKEESS